jgi:hypothetical protein
MPVNLTNRINALGGFQHAFRALIRDEEGLKLGAVVKAAVNYLPLTSEL